MFERYWNNLSHAFCHRSVYTQAMCRSFQTLARRSPPSLWRHRHGTKSISPLFQQDTDRCEDLFDHGICQWILLHADDLKYSLSAATAKEWIYNAVYHSSYPRQVAIITDS